MKKIKIGQIGVCHEHAAGKIKALRLRPDLFEIVGVADDRQLKTPRFAGDDLTPYDGLKMMSEAELLAIPGLEAVTVEVPNLELVPTAKRVLAQGLAMHMDKPGGENYADFTALREECEAKHIPFQMGYMFRANPAILRAVELVKNGTLGEILSVETDMNHNYGGDAYQTYLGNFAGGIMFNLGCHLIDFIVLMLGEPQQVTPFLMSATPGVKNNTMAILEYGNTLVTLQATSLSPDGLDRRQLLIRGTKGSLHLTPLERFDGKPLTVHLRFAVDSGEFKAGEHTLTFAPRRDRYEEQMAEFAAMIRGETADRFDAAHDCLVQKILLAASGYTRWRV